MIDMKCDRCGGDLIDAGIEIYCPNEECWRLDWAEAVAMNEKMILKSEINRSINILEANGYIVTKKE